MATLCPFCNTEVRESEIEAEDGCCPECGAQIVSGSSFEMDDNRRGDWDDDDRDYEDGDEDYGDILDEDGEDGDDGDGSYARGDLDDGELFGDDELDSEFPEDYREEFAEDEEEF